MSAPEILYESGAQYAKSDLQTVPMEGEGHCGPQVSTTAPLKCSPS